MEGAGEFVFYTRSGDPKPPTGLAHQSVGRVSGRLLRLKNSKDRRAASRQHRCLGAIGQQKQPEIPERWIRLFHDALEIVLHEAEQLIPVKGGISRKGKR